MGETDENPPPDKKSPAIEAATDHLTASVASAAAAPSANGDACTVSTQSTWDSSAGTDAAKISAAGDPKISGDADKRDVDLRTTESKTKRSSDSKKVDRASKRARSKSPPKQKKKKRRKSDSSDSESDSSSTDSSSSSDSESDKKKKKKESSSTKKKSASRKR